MKALLQYAFNWLNLFDRAFNVLLGGDPRQTLSSRMGRNVALGRCRFCGYVCRVLSLIQRDHCAKAWASEQVPLDPDMQTTGV